MKTTVAFLALATVVQTTAFAQSFTPGNAHGGHRHHSSRHNHHDHGRHHHHNNNRTTVRVGVGFYPSSYYYSPYRYPYAYRAPYYGAYGYGYPGYGYADSGYYTSSSSSSGSRASTGLILGGIAGAIIGNNSGDLRHNAWRGAAIGAGTGWLLGSIADSNARARENDQPAAVSQPAVATTTTAPAQSSVPQTVIINNNYYGTPSAMSSANAMFGR